MNKPAVLIEQRAELAKLIDDWQDEISALDIGTPSDCKYELLDAIDELLRIEGEMRTWTDRTLLAASD